MTRPKDCILKPERVYVHRAYPGEGSGFIFTSKLDLPNLQGKLTRSCGETGHFVPEFLTGKMK